MEGRQLRLFELAPEQWLRSKIDICSKSQRWPRYRQISCPDRPEYVEGRAGKQGGIAGYIAIRPYRGRIFVGEPIRTIKRLLFIHLAIRQAALKQRSEFIGVIFGIYPVYTMALKLAIGIVGITHKTKFENSQSETI